MKVLLINPPNSVDKKSDFTVNVFQPIGLAYLASVLEKNNYKVKILDALALGFENERIEGNKKSIGLDDPEIKKRINKEKPDIVGISIPFSLQSEKAFLVAKLVKEVSQKIIVVVGGIHPTIKTDEVLKDKNVNFAIRGEGEKVFLELVKAIDQNKSVSNIKNLSYKNQSGKIIHNPSGEQVKDLDSFPFPARHLLPMEIYHQAAKKGRVNEVLLAFGKRRTSIFTSRGCPYHCSFCSVFLMAGRIWRFRSPENVVSEIKQCVEKFNIKYFDILDDNFTLDPSRAKEICRLLIKENLKIKWSTPNGIRADTLDEELIILMKKSGCLQIKIAPESGSQRILIKVIKKNLDLKKVKNVVVLCRKHYLSVEAFFVIGFPQEKESDIVKTINYAKDLRRLGCDYCYFFIATPYFGTEMYTEALAKGYLKKQDYDSNKIFTTSNIPLLKNPNIPPERLLELKKRAEKMNPLLTKIRFWSGIRMLLVDPLRIFNYFNNYLKNF